MKGYHGRFLEIDLNNQTTQDLPLSEDFCKTYIGGATMAAALIYDRITPDIDPLSPENPMVMATGPFTGSPIPMVSRYAVCGVSPLTGFWGEATSGGTFPFRLKGAGWDGIIINGRADKPVYLYLNDGQSEIRDASELWGQDSYETQRIIKNETGDRKISVACIGQAGEKMIKYACIINDKGRAAGRCGLGALMGSKNLKAVAASGNKRPKYADSAKVTALAKQAVKDINGNLVSVALREYGTLMYMDMGMTLGDTPAKYFTKSVFPASEVTGQALRQKYSVASYACRGCPIGCGRDLQGFKPGLDVDGPEYETTVVFGPLCMNTDLDSIIAANHMCNVHGIDTISAGVCVAYAIYLYEHGILTKEQVGFELKWASGKTVLKLVELIVNQEGIGVLLSKGTLAMARELGRDEGEAAQIENGEGPGDEHRCQELAEEELEGAHGGDEDLRDALDLLLQDVVHHCRRRHHDEHEEKEHRRRGDEEGLERIHLLGLPDLPRLRPLQKTEPLHLAESVQLPDPFLVDPRALEADAADLSVQLVLDEVGKGVEGRRLGVVEDPRILAAVDCVLADHDESE